MPTNPIDTIPADSILHALSDVKEICSQNPPNNAFDWFSLIASIVTVLGFAFTLYEIMHIKTTNESIKDELQKQSKRIEKSLTLITISDAIRLADMVILLIDGGLYREAKVRMQDLNKAAIELKQKYPRICILQMALPSEMDHLKDIEECNAKQTQCAFHISNVRLAIQRLYDEMSKIESELKSQTINEK